MEEHQREVNGRLGGPPVRPARSGRRAAALYAHQLTRLLQQGLPGHGGPSAGAVHPGGAGQPYYRGDARRGHASQLQVGAGGGAEGEAGRLERRAAARRF